MSLARVLNFRPYPKKDCRGWPASNACQSSLPASTVSRASCVCRASASSPIDTKAILTRLRGSILLYDDLVPLRGQDSISLHVWCAPPTRCQSHRRQVVLLPSGTHGMYRRLIKQLPLEERVKLLELPPKGFRRCDCRVLGLPDDIPHACCCHEQLSTGSSLELQISLTRVRCAGFGSSLEDCSGAQKQTLSQPLERGLLLTTSQKSMYDAASVPSHLLYSHCMHVDRMQGLCRTA